MSVRMYMYIGIHMINEYQYANVYNRYMYMSMYIIYIFTWYFMCVCICICIVMYIYICISVFMYYVSVLMFYPLLGLSVQLSCHVAARK